MFLTKRGKYWYVIYIDELTGLRKMVSTKTKLKGEAFKFLCEIKERIIPKPKIVSLSDLRTAVIDHVNYHLRKSSVLLYESAFRNMDKLWGNILVKFISIDYIESYKKYRLNSGVRKATVNRELTTMHAIFNLAVQWRIINLNPCNGIKKFRIEEREKLAFSDEEIELIIKNTKDFNFKSIITFALFTGCRLDEILWLQWKDIDFIQRSVIIRNKELFNTKSGKNRYLPISNQLLVMLQDIKPNNNNESLDHFVFGKRGKYRYNKNHISKKFKKLLRNLNFPEKFHFHCLRHTFITQLVKKGVNIFDIKQLAGHSCIETTELYMHTITEDLRKAVNLINI